MSDIQKLVAAPALTSTVMIIDDSEHGSGLRKRDAGNTRRMALHRVLTREHTREMRAAVNGELFDNLWDDCDDSGRHIIMGASADRDHRFIIATSNRSEHSVVTLPGKVFQDDSAVSDFLAVCGGAFLDEVVADLNSMYSVNIDVHELKLHDYFWVDQESNNTKERSMNFHTQDTDMTNIRSANDDEFAATFFAFHHDADEPVYEASSLRRKFIDLPGGRTKRAKNRFDNFYGNSDYHRPTRRQKGFADAEVIGFLEDAAQLASDKRNAERRREMMASIESNANSGARNHRSSKRGRGKVTQQPTVEVITQGRSDWSRRLPPGYVMKTETGKLVWVAYEQALAA